MVKFSEFIKDSNIKKYILIGLCQLIIMGISIFCYDYFFKQRVGVVNITGITDAFIKTQSRESQSPEELKSRVHTFAISLEKGLNFIGARNRAVLMPAEAVITGARDYTKEVQRYLTTVLPDTSLSETKRPGSIKAELDAIDLTQNKQGAKFSSEKDKEISYTNNGA